MSAQKNNNNNIAIDEYDEVYELETRQHDTAPRQPLRTLPQNQLILPRHGRGLAEILRGSDTTAAKNTRRRARPAAKIIEEEEDDDDDDIVFLPRNRRRTAPSKIVNDDEEEEDEEDEDGIVVAPRNRKRRAAPSKIVEEEEDEDEDGGVQLRGTRTPKRLRRRSRTVNSYAVHQDSDASADDALELIENPQNVAIFEDDAFAAEQDDDEEEEDDDDDEGAHQDRQASSRASRSKRPGTGKQRKPNRPREPDTFERLHMGSTTPIPCSREESDRRRFRWRHRLCVCLESYRSQCRDIYAWHQDYDKAMAELCDQQIGPFAKTVASMLIRGDLDIVKAVDEEILPNYPQTSTDILGAKDVTLQMLLQLPRLSDEDLSTRGCYLKLVYNTTWQQYWGSATGMFGLVKRWQNYDDMIRLDNTNEGDHCTLMLEPGAEVHVRAVATHFGESSGFWAIVNEGLLMTIFGSVENVNQADGWANSKVFDFVRQARRDMTDLDITLEQVSGLNRTSSLKQGVKFNGRVPPCCNCHYQIEAGELRFWAGGIPYSRSLCRRCYRYSLEHPGENRPVEYEPRRIMLRTLRENKSDDDACEGNCNTHGSKWGYISDLWVCASCYDWEKINKLPITSPEGIERCSIIAAARPAYGIAVSNRAVRDVGKSTRSADNKCQGNGCDAQAIQRGPVSKLFLCNKCRDYERFHKHSINSPERAAYLQKKEQEVDSRPKDGICQGTHCNQKHGKRGRESRLYLCNSCIGFEYTRKLSVNSPDGLTWQLQRNSKK